MINRPMVVRRIERLKHIELIVLCFLCSYLVKSLSAMLLGARFVNLVVDRAGGAGEGPAICDEGGLEWHIDELYSEQKASFYLNSRGGNSRLVCWG